MDAKRDRLVIFASTLGTVFEWYDFFVYGTLAAIIGKQFFPAASETAQFLLALATFGVGFGVRPIGAVLFGYLGDRLGRKYTFLVTDHADGPRHRRGRPACRPMRDRHRRADPARLPAGVLQGLALGGEYGGAAIYVAEHAPRQPARLLHQLHPGGRDRRLPAQPRGRARLRRCSSIQAAWESWGWRIPFLFSIVLLAVSLWIRLKLKESPVFQAMKAGGRGRRATRCARASTAGPNVKLVLVALVRHRRRADRDLVHRAVPGAVFPPERAADRGYRGAADRRRGRGVQPVLVRPVRLAVATRSAARSRSSSAMSLTHAADLPAVPLDGGGAPIPELAAAMARAPVVVTGSDCTYDPFATKGQATAVRQAARRAVEEGRRLYQGRRARRRRAGGDDRRRGRSTPPIPAALDAALADGRLQARQDHAAASPARCRLVLAIVADRLPARA